MKKNILAVALALTPYSAFASDTVAQGEAMATVGKIEIHAAYSRSANPKSGAVFMTITNAGQACVLQGAETTAAKRAELHTHREMENGVMQMAKVEDGFAVPEEGEHMLMRGGDHIMLMGLNAPLSTGMQVPLTLDFGDCGSVSLDVPVDNDRTVMHGSDPAMMKAHQAMPKG